MWCVPHECVEDVYRGTGQEPPNAPLGEFACSCGDKDKRFRFDRAIAGAPGEVGQCCHATHGVPCEGEWAFYAKRYNQRGEIFGELLDAVRVHGRARGAAMAPVVVADDSDVFAPLADQLTDLHVPRRLVQAKAMQKDHSVVRCAR
jgi:hypothetical protein